MASYSVEIKPPAQKGIRSIDDRATRGRVIAKIRSPADDPRPIGSVKMSGFSDAYRIQQGDYRIIYEIEDDRLIVLLGGGSNNVRAFATNNSGPGVSEATRAVVT